MTDRNTLDAAIGDRLAELADGTNYGTLAELQDELLAWSMDLRSGAQSILDYAQQDETSAEPDWRAICLRLRDAVAAEGEAMRWSSGVGAARRTLAKIWDEVSNAQKTSAG